MKPANDNGASPPFPSTARPKPMAAGADGYLGLLLEADECDFRLVLLTREGGRQITFGPYDDLEVGPAWRALSIASGLRMLHRDGAGLLVELGSPAALAIRRPAADRKRLVVLAGRRPRFLTRRKVGRVAARAATADNRDAPASTEL